MVANAAMVIMEQFFDSEYYGVTPHITSAYVPHFFQCHSFGGSVRQADGGERAWCDAVLQVRSQADDRSGSGRAHHRCVRPRIDCMRVNISKAHLVLLHSRRIFHGWQAR